MMSRFAPKAPPIFFFLSRLLNFVESESAEIVTSLIGRGVALQGHEHEDIPRTYPCSLIEGVWLPAGDADEFQGERIFASRDVI
jgi:hypothetical protein